MECPYCSYWALTENEILEHVDTLHFVDDGELSIDTIARKKSFRANGQYSIDGVDIEKLDLYRSVEKTDGIIISQKFYLQYNNLDETFDELAIKILYEYQDELLLSETRTWYLEDGTVGVVKKVSYYTDEETEEERAL